MNKESILWTKLIVQTQHLMNNLLPIYFLSLSLSPDFPI